jgi:hypothetical protein
MSERKPDTPPGQDPDFVPPGQGGTPPGQDKPRPDQDLPEQPQPEPKR